MVLELNHIITGGIEGTVIQITSFGSKPEFILIYKDHHFDRNYNVVNTKDWPDDDKRWVEMGIRFPTLTDQLLRTIGLYWVGLPPRKVAMRDATWSEWSHVKKDGSPTEDRLIRPRAEPTRYFFIRKFGYAFHIKGLEVRAGFKVDMKFTVFVKGVNPKIALVDNDDWYMQFDGLIRRRVKDFIGAKSFYQLLSEEPAAQALLRKYNPLQRYLDKKNQDKVLGEEETVTDTFAEYLISMPGFKERKKAGSGEPEKVELPLSEVLGVSIVDATFEDIDLDEKEPLKAHMSKIELQEQENARKLGEAETDWRIKTGTAAAEAQAMDTLTEAKEKRRKVHERYQGKPHATAVAIAELDAENASNYAQAIQKNGSLRSIVLPGTNVRPVHVVNDDKE
jgi:hypothetical protein